jgi:GNAT superfamily N-acetyltransferase
MILVSGRSTRWWEDRPVEITIRRNPPLTGELRRRLVEIWVDATNAGGALGLVSPATAESAQGLAAATWRGVERGSDDLFVACLGPTPVGWTVLSPRNDGVTPHWRTVKRLQVHPEQQGRGYGRALLTELEQFSLAEGLEALHLTLRDGTGVDRFYRALGFREIARIPRALRVGPGDDRDEVYMVKSLR